MQWMGENSRVVYAQRIGENLRAVSTQQTGENPRAVSVQWMGINLRARVARFNRWIPVGAKKYTEDPHFTGEVLIIIGGNIRLGRVAVHATGMLRRLGTHLKQSYTKQ